MNFLLSSKLKFALYALTLLGLITASAPVFAAPAEMSLKAMIELGLRQSGRIKKREADLTAAQSQTRRAVGAAFPTVNLKAAATEHDDEFYRAYAEATQPLYTGGALTAAYKLSKQNEELKQLELKNETQKYLFELITTYLKTVNATNTLSATLENLDILKRHAAVIAKYEKIGRARKSDLLLSKVNVITAEHDIQRQRAELIADKEILRSLVETELPPEILNSSHPAFYTQELIDADKAVSYAFENSLSLKIAKLLRERINHEKKVALAEDLPSLSLTGQSGFRRAIKDDLFKDNAQYSSVTLNLTIPLFSGLTMLAKRRDFEEQKVSATSDFEVKKFQIEASLRSKIVELKVSQEQLQYIEEAARDAREALRLAERDYANSLISSQDIIGVQRTRFEAQRLLLQSRYEFAINLLTVRELMGVELEKLYAR